MAYRRLAGTVAATGCGSSGKVGSNTTSYVTPVSYAPHGAPQQAALGNGLTEQTCFNNMLQPFVIRQRRASATSCLTGQAADGNDVGYFSFAFPAGNNGNVAGQTIQYAASGSYSSMTFQQTYGYDGVNRPSSVSETGGGAAWSQSFGYDLVGNRWLSGGTAIDVATTPTTDVFNANNQINATGYDAKGNQTQSGGFVFQYDAENRLITSNMLGTTYGYDADGRRATKTSSGVTTAYVYDVTGQLAAQYATGGTGTAPCATTCYLMTDHLGSTRMQTDSGGNQSALYDYAPFGEELAGLGGRDARWGGFGSGIHFTGKEQEGYEGEYMHYFGARYFSAGWGRFTSPDPESASASIFDPQLWNGYSYAVNSPLKFVDRDGQLPLLAATALIGAGVGAVGGAVFDIANQAFRNGGRLDKVDPGEVGTAALGGLVSGGVAGLGLGFIEAPAALTWGYLATSAAVNGGANVVGGMVQREANDFFDIPQNGNPFDSGSIAWDFATGAAGGAAGTALAYRIYPLVNVRKQAAAIANSSRRSTRPIKLANLDRYARQQQRGNIVIGSVSGTSATNGFANLLLFIQLQSQPQVTTRICFDGGPGGCPGGSQSPQSRQ